MFCHMLKPNESSMLCCTGPVKPAGSFFPGWSVQRGWNIPSCSLCSHSLLCSPPSADSLQQTQPGKAYGTCWKRALHFLTSPPSSTRQSRAQGNPVQTCQNQAKQTSQKQLECAASFLPSLPVTTKNTAGRAGVGDPLAASPWRGMQGKALPANQQLRLGLPWGRDQPSPIHPAELLHGQGAASQTRLRVTPRRDSELRKGKRRSWQRGLNTSLCGSLQLCEPWS